MPGAYLLGGRVEFGHVRVAAEQLGNDFLEDPHAVAVHDADAAGGGHYGAVEEFIHGVARLLCALADYVDLLVQGRQLRRGLVTHTLG
jgi:hypothetical protein